ncbi:hypothetical protein [Guyparkeria sp. SCN-R1]|nr:hypothetical protein [Guyparkeria sp. SCN-R1]
MKTRHLLLATPLALAPLAISPALAHESEEEVEVDGVSGLNG